MHRPVMVAIACAAALAGCSQTREVAYITAPVDSPVAVPRIDTNPFSLNSTQRVEHFYRGRLAEQPPLPLAIPNSYIYYKRSVTHY